MKSEYTLYDGSVALTVRSSDGAVYFDKVWWCPRWWGCEPYYEASDGRIGSFQVGPRISSPPHVHLSMACAAVLIVVAVRYGPWSALRASFLGGCMYLRKRARALLVVGMGLAPLIVPLAAQAQVTPTVLDPTLTPASIISVVDANLAPFVVAGLAALAAWKAVGWIFHRIKRSIGNV